MPRRSQSKLSRFSGLEVRTAREANSCHFPKPASAVAVEIARPDLPDSAATSPKPAAAGRILPEPAAARGGGAVVPDLSLIPEAAWREARRRAEVVRPLAERPCRSRHLVRAAATTLGLSERQTY